MRVLFLVPFPLDGPSSRMRVWQYLPALHKLGIETTVLPFVSERYFRRHYQAGTSAGKVAHLLGFQLRRGADALRARHYDVVVVQREAAVFGPPVFERFIAGRLARPLVFDFDDAISRVSPKYGWKAPLVGLVKCPGKTRQLLELSRAVVVGNRELETYAGEFNRDVTLIPTVVDHERITPRSEPRRDGDDRPLVLGWMGSHSTRPYIEGLLPVLRELSGRLAVSRGPGQAPDLVLRVIGAGRPVHDAQLCIENREWSLQSEVGELRDFDIGLYPLPDDDWARGKSGFKAVQNMAVGVPTVASPVGATADILTDGVTGFLPRTDQEWVDRLELLVRDPNLRGSMGRAGRRQVEDWYCVARQAPRWKEVLERASSR